MPRGVYDRSKSKAARAAAKTESPATAKKTWSRKAKSTESHAAGIGADDRSNLTFLREHLIGLTQARVQAGNIPALTGKIDAQITKTVDQIDSAFTSIFPGQEVEQTTEAARPRNSNQQVAPAPVPFNPPQYAAPTQS